MYRTFMTWDVYQRSLTERQLPQAVVKAIYTFPYSRISTLSVAVFQSHKQLQANQQLLFFVRTCWISPDLIRKCFEPAVKLVG